MLEHDGHHLFTHRQFEAFLCRQPLCPVVGGGAVLRSRGREQGRDRKMILLRDTAQSMPLQHKGVDPSRRFAFYDQVHTTGMDIKQGPNAVAVLTLGKDMTFRDYAQGAYRMRGIGKGQTIVLFVIPEVQRLCVSETALGMGVAPSGLEQRRAALADAERRRSELEGISSW